MLLLLNHVEGILHFLRRAPRLRAQGGPDDLPILDQEGLAHRKSDERNRRHSECSRNRAVTVSDEHEGQLSIGLEFFLGVNGVLADSDDLQTFSVKALVGIAQGAGFCGATWRLRFGVKIDKGDPLSVNILEDHFLPILIQSGDLGRLGTGSKRFGTGENGK